MSGTFIRKAIINESIDDIVGLREKATEGDAEDISNYGFVDVMFSSEKHYARNQLNISPSDDLDYYLNNDEWFHEPKDTYHRIKVDSNTEVYKFVTLVPDENGMYKEAVFHDGKLVIMEENSPNEHFDNVIKDSVNAGTINYESTKSDIWGHAILDVLPFYNYDNDPIGLEKKYERKLEEIKNKGEYKAKFH